MTEYKDKSQYIIFCEAGCGEPVGLFYPSRALSDEELHLHTHTGMVCEKCWSGLNGELVKDGYGYYKLGSLLSK